MCSPRLLRRPLDLIRGTDGADNLNGTAGADLVYGRGGNDNDPGARRQRCRLCRPGERRRPRRSGNDAIYAGEGNDVTWAGAGADVQSTRRRQRLLHALANDNQRDILDCGHGFDVAYVIVHDPARFHGCEQVIRLTSGAAPRPGRRERRQRLEEGQNDRSPGVFDLWGSRRSVCATPSFLASLVGERPVPDRPELSLECADSEDADVAADTELLERRAHRSDRPVQVRGDLLVGERGVLVQQLEDRPLHPREQRYPSAGPRPDLYALPMTGARKSYAVTSASAGTSICRDGSAAGTCVVSTRRAPHARCSLPEASADALYIAIGRNTTRRPKLAVGREDEVFGLDVLQREPHVVRHVLGGLHLQLAVTDDPDRDLLVELPL